MATIEDVARAAGVSRSTVSYALSGKRSISRETQKRVEQAIAELGFTVNAGARALATSQTMSISLGSIVVDSLRRQSRRNQLSFLSASSSKRPFFL